MNDIFYFADENAAVEIVKSVREWKERAMNDNIQAISEDDLILTIRSIIDESAYEIADNKDDAKSSLAVIEYEGPYIRVKAGDIDYIDFAYSNDDIETETAEVVNDPIISKETCKMVLKVGGLILTGVVIGRLTGRYKPWNGTNKYTIPGEDIDAVMRFVEAENKTWRDNHLVLCKDKRYKKCHK